MAKETKQLNEQNSIQNKRGRQYFNLDEEKAFFEEVDEEVRNEKFKQLINKYGGFILTILILALSLAVGYEKIGEWKLRKAEQKNVQYIQAVSPKSDYESNIAELENIVATEKGLYKDMANLQIANILIDHDQKDRGLAVLEQLYSDANVADKIREIAAVKLATYKVDTASLEEVKSILSFIINNDKSSWRDMAKELVAMSAIQHKNYEMAKNIYQELLTNGHISDEFKARIDDMLVSISDAQK